MNQSATYAILFSGNALGYSAPVATQWYRGYFLCETSDFRGVGVETSVLPRCLSA
jgi:hypothetical protein